MSSGVGLSVGVARWSYWEATEAEPHPEIPEVAAGLRRRLSPADRAALRVAFDCAGPAHVTPAVFCSRHGQVGRSVALLEQLCAGEALSPTAFSLSVHNSAVGPYSIARADTSPMSAIAAGRDSLPQGAFEAAALLAGGAEQVLLVAYDAALPAAFQKFRDEEDRSYGLALLLKSAAALQLTLELVASSEPPGARPHACQLAQFLASQALELTIPAGRRRWIWLRA